MKHIACDCSGTLDGKKCNSELKWNNDKYACECKNPLKQHTCGENYVRNPTIGACEWDKTM